MNPSPLTANFLEPYKQGGESCLQNTNCMSCTADFLCAWCSESRQCFPKASEDHHCPRSAKLTPGQCTNCTSNIYCHECLNNADGPCEWLAEESRCVRDGRYSKSIRNESSCPQLCHERDSCDTCIGDPGRCVWCEETQVSKYNIKYDSFSESFCCFRSAFCFLSTLLTSIMDSVKCG